MKSFLLLPTPFWMAVKNKANSVADVLSLPFESITVGEKITEMTGKIGEKIEVSHLEQVEGEAVVDYIHSNGKLGVLVALKNTAMVPMWKKQVKMWPCRLQP
jgi:elongation factor Ts